VTYVFYTAEEIAAEHSGLLQLFRERPELMAGDAAVLGEPTGAAIEAGCQGTLRARVTCTGARAHTARPWMGVNAIHRLGAVLARVDAYEARRPVLDGCEYREALQAVAVDGGVAGNVVPDRASVTLNHRYAPDRTGADAAEHVRSVVALGDGDTFEVLDIADGAPPALDHPLLARLARGREVRAKLGWTDVARMHEHGIPACNFGPGDPTIAHTRDEHVHRSEIEAVHAALLDVLTGD
jgi:succinyl-diaminopimelate desuccinylase